MFNASPMGKNTVLSYVASLVKVAFILPLICTVFFAWLLFSSVLRFYLPQFFRLYIVVELAAFMRTASHKSSVFSCSVVCFL